jgi:hypothetical protein
MNTMTSRSARDAWKKSLAGQSIFRLVPSTSVTVGRVTWKSKNSSGSRVANFDAAQRSRR